jgi:hypothetical protein
MAASGRVSINLEMVADNTNPAAALKCRRYALDVLSLGPPACPRKGVALYQT